VIAAFPSLFGTPSGERVREWCRRYRWTLVWSLGLNLGLDPDHGMPHFWDIKDRPGPFWVNHRLVDPAVQADINASVRPGDVAAFSAAWSRTAAARGLRKQLPQDWKLAWEHLTGNTSSALRIFPLRATSCANSEDCVGVTADRECVCKVKRISDSVVV